MDAFPVVIFLYCEMRWLIMQFLRDVWGFLRVRKKFWLLPLLLALLLLGALVMFTGGTAVAPFIYTLF